jgi:hypothetical protein
VIEIEAFEDGEDLEVVTRIRDQRPWAPDQPYATVHDMTITVRVGEDMRVVSADAAMAKHPHSECPRIAAAYRGLVGLSVARGWSREIKARFSGVDGCAHMAQAALAIAPATLQARVSRTARRSLSGDGGTYDTGARGFALNSCHLWAEGGVIESKLDLGWQPGMWGDYPAEPVEVIRERLAADGS